MRQFALTFGLTAMLVFGFAVLYTGNVFLIDTAHAIDFLDEGDEEDNPDLIHYGDAEDELDADDSVGSGPGSSGTAGSGPGSSGTTGSGPGHPAGGGSGSGSLVNPLGPEVDTIPKFLIRVIEILLIFAVPIIVLFIMYAGFLYVTARGDTSQISKAHSALTWSVIGGVIVLGALLIVNVIQGTVAAI